MSESSDRYTIQQTAEALRIPVQKVIQLIGEGKLQAYYDEEKGYRLVDASSIRSYLLKKPPPEQRPSASATPAPDPPPRSEERNRMTDTVVLIIIALITLVAAVYTIVTALLSGG